MGKKKMGRKQSGKRVVESARLEGDDILVDREQEVLSIPGRLLDKRRPSGDYCYLGEDIDWNNLIPLRVSKQVPCGVQLSGDVTLTYVWVHPHHRDQTYEVTTGRGLERFDSVYNTRDDILQAARSLGKTEQEIIYAIYDIWRGCIHKSEYLDTLSPTSACLPNELSKMEGLNAA
ncbi:hypothetical protein BX600DRAFT_536814 [Xylariales sp. PMI_506]|nr:hypothetical protein BX600DRAFT_536814 [Xylariales sp. PMI_506]